MRHPDSTAAFSPCSKVYQIQHYRRQGVPSVNMNTFIRRRRNRLPIDLDDQDVAVVSGRGPRAERLLQQLRWFEFNGHWEFTEFAHGDDSKKRRQRNSFRRCCSTLATRERS